MLRIEKAYVRPKLNSTEYQTLRKNLNKKVKINGTFCSRTCLNIGRLKKYKTSLKKSIVYTFSLRSSKAEREKVLNT